MPADIIALKAAPSFKAAMQDGSDLTPAGGVKGADPGSSTGRERLDTEDGFCHG